MYRDMCGVNDDNFDARWHSAKKQWRVEERDDWRALLDSMQADRTALQHQNDRLEVSFARAVALVLLSLPCGHQKRLALFFIFVSFWWCGHHKRLNPGHPHHGSFCLLCLPFAHGG